jgi:hypothetical protein
MGEKHNFLLGIKKFSALQKIKKALNIQFFLRQKSSFSVLLLFDTQYPA